MNWIYYCTEERFKEILNSFTAMEKLMDREYKKPSCHAACQHVWNIAKGEKFVFVQMSGWTYRCTDCFNEHMRKSIQPYTCKELGIPNVQGKAIAIISLA